MARQILLIDTPLFKSNGRYLFKSYVSGIPLFTTKGNSIYGRYGGAPLVTVESDKMRQVYGGDEP